MISEDGGQQTKQWIDWKQETFFLTVNRHISISSITLLLHIAFPHLIHCNFAMSKNYMNPRPLCGLTDNNLMTFYYNMF